MVPSQLNSRLGFINPGLTLFHPLGSKVHRHRWHPPGLGGSSAMSLRFGCAPVDHACGRRRDPFFLGGGRKLRNSIVSHNWRLVSHNWRFNGIWVGWTMVYTLAISGSEQGPRDDKNPERWQAVYQPCITHIVYSIRHVPSETRFWCGSAPLANWRVVQDLGGSTYNSLAVSTALIYLPFRFLDQMDDIFWKAAEKHPPSRCKQPRLK